MSTGYKPADLAVNYCQRAQKQLAQLINSPLNTRRQLGLLDCLVKWKNANDRGETNLEFDPIIGPYGEFKEYQISFYKPLCEDLADTECSENLCDADEPDDTCQVNWCPDKCLEFSLKFTEKKLRRQCMQPDDYIAQEVSKKLEKAHEALNRRLIKQVKECGYIGNFVGKDYKTPYDAPETVNILNNYGQINPDGQFELMQLKRRSRLSGRPHVIGSGNWERYRMYEGLACCNDFGVDPSKMGSAQFDFYLDEMVDECFFPDGTANNALVVYPGFLQLLTYNKNRDWYINGGVDRMSERRVFVDQLGLEWDNYIVVKDNCVEDVEIIIKFKLRYGLWGIPEKATCYGVTGVQHVIGACNNGEIACGTCPDDK